MVPEERLELSRCCQRQILSLLRLPIPPLRQLRYRRYIVPQKTAIARDVVIRPNRTPLPPGQYHLVGAGTPVLLAPVVVIIVHDADLHLAKKHGDREHEHHDRDEPQRTHEEHA